MNKKKVERIFVKERKLKTLAIAMGCCVDCFFHCKLFFVEIVTVSVVGVRISW